MKNSFEEIRLSKQLPSPSGVGLKILQITRHENFCTDEIAQAIMMDSVLTGRLLKLANSAMNASAETITTVNQATMRLGVTVVKNVALGLSLLTENSDGPCKDFDFGAHWSRSLARAIGCQMVSRSLGKAAHAEAYICGLLASFGRLTLACVHPEQYSGVVSRVPGWDHRALREAEHDAFEISSAEICALMMEEWGLPEAFQQAALIYQEDGCPTDEGLVSELVDVLRYGEALAEVCVPYRGGVAPYAERARADLDALRLALCMDEVEFDGFCQQLVEEWSGWGETLGISTSKQVDFTLTEVTPASPEQCEVETEENDEDRDKLRVLVVDDDPTSIKLVETLLATNGYKVHCASNGEEGLELALRINPHIVVADWEMPGMSGTEMCQALRKLDSGKRMYFILLTGHVGEDAVVRAFDAGVDDYVSKPFNGKLLLARIKGGRRVVRLQLQVDRDTQTMRKQVAELGNLTRKLRSAALTDVLTELPNRRYAIKRLEQEWSKSRRDKVALSVVLIDIDFFKKVNDEHGHDIGDVVLRETAKVMRSRARKSEDVCRIGGEEFLVICENSTADQARLCAERIRMAVQEHHIKCGTFDRTVTVSMGVADSMSGPESINELLKSADEAVYQAKEGGRNCVVVRQVESNRKSA